MQQQKLNVLFIPSWYPTAEKPTLGIFIQRHAEAIAMLHNIYVINVLGDTATKKTTCEVFNKKNVYTIVAKYPKTNSTIVKLFRSLNAFKQAYNLLKKEKGKVDVVHLHVIFPAAVFVLFTSFFKNIALVISEHWSGYMPEDGNYRDFLMKTITKTAVRRAKKIIAVSEKMKTAILNHGLANNYTVIPNVVNTQVFYPNKENKRDDTFNFIHVSSINDREKNISGILRTVKKLSDKKQNFSLNIIGNSPEADGFKKMAEQFGLLNKQVFFKGELTSDQVADEMRKSDAFLLFSNYEGLPCVILEALACGLPVIATNTGGIPTVINKSNGVLVKVKDEDALLNAMEDIMNNTSKYDKNIIATDAEKKFAYLPVAKQIDAVYQEILTK